jgi:hypothetical protein
MWESLFSLILIKNYHYIFSCDFLTQAKEFKMCGKKLFVRWWLGFVVISIASLVLYRLNIFSEIYQKDSSYLSWLIFFIFFYMTIWCGNKCWIADKMIEGSICSEETKCRIIRNQETGWFMSDLCLSIGMIGTVVGFIMMLSGFTKIDVANPDSIKNTISTMASGMATALYTTLVGLICGSLLKIQYFSLSQALEQLKDSEGDINVQA